MEDKRWLLPALIASQLLVTGGIRTVSACTGITLKAQDGAVVFARTLEFGANLDSDVMVIPRGYARAGTTPDGKAGLKWTTKYASVGANGMGVPFLFEGLNEKGLQIGMFYFPGFAGYEPYKSTDADRTIAPWEIGSWILENFSSVNEVRDNLGKIVVPAVVLKAMGFPPPVHYAVSDSSGESIVIEYVDGKLNIYDNPLGTLTNSPTFDWHMTNLRNYVNMSFTDAPPVRLGSVEIAPLGQGSGMLGLPGDFTPPSRFVRAALFSQGTPASRTGYESVLQAFHILHNFDIPMGVARDKPKDANGNVTADYTQWTSACDLKAKRFYIWTHANSQIRLVDLMKMNLDAKDIALFSLKGKEVIETLTPSMTSEVH